MVVDIDRDRDFGPGVLYVFQKRAVASRQNLNPKRGVFLSTNLIARRGLAQILERDFAQICFKSGAEKSLFDLDYFRFRCLLRTNGQIILILT